MKRLVLVAPVVGLLLPLMGMIASAAHADTNVALGKPVTGSGFYDSGTEVFPYTNITDGLLNDSGSPGAWSFWLTPQGQTGFATIDLQGSFLVDSFSVQNTHNRGFDDRGTDGFTIGLSTNGTTFTQAVVGNLPFSTAATIPFETFDIVPTTASFVRFTITSFVGNSGGINELEVLGSPASSVAPEPGTPVLWGALLGCALPVGLVLRRRQAGRSRAI